MTGSIDSVVATGRGDDGTTGLLYGGERISKDDLRAEAYGTIDEAVAALGVARALLGLKADRGLLGPAFDGLADMILTIQRDLFVAAAELATNPAAWARLEDGRTRVSPAMVAETERLLVETERRITMPREFVVPGESTASAALEVARTVLRRAERRAVSLRRAELLPEGVLLTYLNRLADLLWVLARAAEQAESRSATPSRLTAASASRTLPTRGARAVATASTRSAPR